MPTFAPPTLLTQNITATLARLRDERADGAPGHNTTTCKGCKICGTERLLNRYLDKLPRRETR